MEQKNSEILQNFRKEIDEIDEKIIDLLQERAEIVQQVKQFKNQNPQNDFSLYIKPDREFEIIEKMKNIKSVYNVNFFQNLWRTIICASNLIEQNLEFASLNEKACFYTSYYFGNLKNVKIYDVKTAFEKLQANEIHIFGFSSNEVEVYKKLLENENIKIFAGVCLTENNFVFFCGKMQGIEKYFDKKSYTITQQEADCKIADGVFKKKTDGKTGKFFGFFYEYYCI